VKVIDYVYNLCKTSLQRIPLLKRGPRTITRQMMEKRACTIDSVNCEEPLIELKQEPLKINILRLRAIRKQTCH
jgi:hypothetical protein